MIIKQTAVEQIEKKVFSWNNTRSIKIAQAKRIQYINDGLEIRLMFINMAVVLCAVFTLGTQSDLILKATLTYSIVIILFQAYIARQNFEGQLTEFKILEVNLDILINELEGMYREIKQNNKNEADFNIKIELLTNKYNAYLRNVPLHLNEDYNRGLKSDATHKRNREEIEKDLKEDIKKDREIKKQDEIKYKEKLIYVTNFILGIGVLIGLTALFTSF